ncbi:18377_t:CDS:1, partial [Racocetra persica]
SEGTNVPKPTMNEQSEVNYREKKFFIQFIEIVVMDSQEAVLRVSNSSNIQKNQKKELLQNKPEGRIKDHGSSSLFSKKM